MEGAVKLSALYDVHVSDHVSGSLLESDDVPQTIIFKCPYVWGSVGAGAYPLEHSTGK